MKHYIILITALLCWLPAGAQVDSLEREEVDSLERGEVKEVSQLWDSANTAYINADFAAAIELYKAIEEQELFSDALYFNLGNAYYKNEDIARAILYYQKALLISPNDQDILHNLNVAQTQTRDQIEEIPELFLRRWNRAISRSFSCTGWSIFSLISLSLFLGAIMLFLLAAQRSLRKAGFFVALFAGVLFWITTLYALGERDELLNRDGAVIMSQSISIKSSPDKSATDLFMLHNGTTVKILRLIDDWYEIVIADGKKGWIESKRVEII